jgi:Tol biopolymer transport system component
VATPGRAPAAAQGGAVSWDVSAPPGPSSTVSLDVSEGTWMSVDVSPDGRELVFDLLGDLYLLPIEGGDARALTSGRGWDVQPRFSPDGAWVAFTSDRGGGDNVWVVARAGGEPRAVTDEDYRLVNSPAWSPDGSYLAVRKHFTSTRSLGAGEIWLYHVAGGAGAGVQLTEPVAVAPAAFGTKMLRWVSVAPDGRSVVFQALGHLYVRGLPAGAPRRLTGDDDVFELYPSISRDGRWVVYTTWHDQRLGDVRVVPLVGGKSRVVSRRPGHYVEPAFSPDGRLIAVRRGDGGTLRSPLYATDPGLYILPASGGPARRVSRDGTAPQFAASADRLFFTCGA